MDLPMSYSQEDLARFRYYLPELKQKLKENPKSLPLRNGIAHIEKILGVPPTTSPVDPLKILAILEAGHKMEREGR